jgi:hypothetical protein
MDLPTKDKDYPPSTNPDVEFQVLNGSDAIAHLQRSHPILPWPPGLLK